MKDTPVLEIKVAFVGPVSSGKSTALNAILREMYSEVAKKRTTAAVNFIRISLSSSLGPTEVEVENESTKEWSMFPDEARSAESVHQEIKIDNEVLRNSDEVKEKYFDIEMRETTCEMWGKVKLVLVDIPGTNEAESNGKYMKYIETNWDKFDCVVALMDGQQGVNTEDQVRFLKSLKKNRDQTRKVPLIILCNKIDNTKNEEQQEMVQELRKAVGDIFEVSDRALSAAQIAAGSTDVVDPYPIFLPISALHAFIYRAARLLTRENFGQLGEPLIEHLGREAFGRSWDRWDKKKKYEMAYDEINSEELYREGIQTSNFETFLQALSFCIGGEANQRSIIGGQIKIAEGKLAQSSDLGASLAYIHDRYSALGWSTDAMNEIFWNIFKGITDTFLDNQADGLSEGAAIIDPMGQILSYVKFAKDIEIISDEKQRIVREAKVLVSRHISMALKQEFLNGKRLTQLDWFLIYGSMLSAASHRHFYEKFNLEKMLLEQSYQEASYNSIHGFCPVPVCREPLAKEYLSLYCTKCPKYYVEQSTEDCPYCATFKEEQNNIEEGSRCLGCSRQYERVESFDHLKPKLELIKRLQVSGTGESATEKVHHCVDIPSSLSDREHFGHLIYMFCCVMDSLED
ncbi:hypothetical protein ACA910_003860 [Epithemia clementina (nom. ined.)]